MKPKSYIKNQICKLTNLSNNELIRHVIEACAFVFPFTGKNEAQQRKIDRITSINGEYGETVTHEKGMINGLLNRNKILIGTTAFYGNDNFGEKDVKLIADGGFDFIITVDRSDFQDRLLTYCEKYDVAAIVNDRVLPGGHDIQNLDYDNCDIFLQYRKKPAQVGDHGWDEPSSENFAVMQKYYNKYKEALPNQFLFNNLFPAGATKKQIGANSYEEYVDRYSKEVNTDYISTDIYPFHPFSTMNKFSLMLCLHTYHCVGNACRRDNKDFWLYIQTQGLWYSHIYDLPSFEKIKWQMYTALCYGARSLIHVAYTPVWDNRAYAMLNIKGELTEQYLYAKKANSEIQKLSDIIKCYRSLGVKPAFAEKENKYFVLAMANQIKNNKKQGFFGLPAVRKIESESSAVAGYFVNETDSNKYALLITDCCGLNDPEFKQKIRVIFRTPVKVKIYEHGILTKKGTVKQKLSFDIGACDGIFIKFEEV